MQKSYPLSVKARLRGKFLEERSRQVLQRVHTQRAKKRSLMPVPDGLRGPDRVAERPVATISPRSRRRSRAQRGCRPQPETRFSVSSMPFKFWQVLTQSTSVNSVLRPLAERTGGLSGTVRQSLPRGPTRQSRLARLGMQRAEKRNPKCHFQSESSTRTLTSTAA